ncbi:hypothetical protein CYY_004874 [Polysphondylium violaceum]|uniref:Histone H2A n=1 Tax=Polysphondylium violaceum TaxID=133409 RepID=A0A8J4USN2_9MYCE|nr:hypothetical protein CYY_004874 [Polysphondylium violaceum]
MSESAAKIESDKKARAAATLAKKEEKAAINKAAAQKRAEAKKNSDKKPESRSARAHITFPVSRVDRLLRDGRYAPRVESTAPVYLAAVLEYLVFEILELAHNICSQNKKTRITPQHINWAVANDLELNQLFQHVTIASGGVLPINTASTEKKASKKTKKPASESAASQTY